jgi:hypothetical protein
VKLLICWLALASTLPAANPYLDLANEVPITRRYSGKEWGDGMTIPEGKDSLPFTAKVTTQRIGVFPWGAAYKVSVTHQGSREIGPYHFITTDDEIVFLANDDVEGKIKKLQALKTKPKFAKSDLCALSSGTLKASNPPWTTEITVKENTCTYRSWHEGAGHFERFIWRKNSGLVAFGAGRGARQDGFELEVKTP